LGSGWGSNYLPKDGDVPGLMRTRPPTTYKSEELTRRLGNQAPVYDAYRVDILAVADYTFDNNSSRRLTIECARTANSVSASGLFHRHRALLGRQGAPVQVGAEGVIDKSREGRNLYFYKNTTFCKLVYSGPLPVPDLPVLARKMADNIGGKDYRPEGYDYLDVEGVNMDSAGVTPGYTLNMDFLPPSVCAFAPGAGTEKASAYVLVGVTKSDAEKWEKDMREVLRQQGSDTGEHKLDDGRWVWWGTIKRDRLIASRKGNVLVIVANGENRRLSGQIMDKIIARVK